MPARLWLWVNRMKIYHENRPGFGVPPSGGFASNAVWIPVISPVLTPHRQKAGLQTAQGAPTI